MTILHASNARSLYSSSKWIMAAIMIVAVTAMATSILTLVQSRSDASAINVSGSLRMQNYRLAYAIERGAPQLEIEQKTVALEQSLNDPSLKVLSERSAPKALREKYQAILNEWQQLKPDLLSPDRHPAYLQSVPEFVGRIDRLVYLIQLHLEDKVYKLALFQVLCLLGLGALAFVTIQFVRRRVVWPLNALITAAQQVQKQQFDIDLPAKRDDELGLLATSFKLMAAELDQGYRGLQRLVASKTDQLRQANDSLSVLYQCSEIVHTHHIDQQMIQNLLEKLRSHLDLNYLGVRLMPDLDISLPREMEAGARGRGVQCHLTLAMPPATLGALLVESDAELADPELQLVEGFSRLLSRVLHVQNLLQREQTLLLLEERSIIARELHDSLAQSLSYLKIQMTRLEHSFKQQPIQPDARAILDEIEQGLSGAYQQLRELLSTFRLSVKANSLEQALEKMITELQPRCKAEISLNYQLHRQVVSPHQLIHVLQIAREAALNAIKHADASNISITCRHLDNDVQLSIEDNGRGIDDDPQKQGHFGLEIMKERATSLSGTLTFEKPCAGGTLVNLSFPEA